MCDETSKSLKLSLASARRERQDVPRAETAKSRSNVRRPPTMRSVKRKAAAAATPFITLQYIVHVDSILNTWFGELSYE